MKSRSPVDTGLGVFARGIQSGIGIISLVCEFVVASLLNGPLADLERELGGACRERSFCQSKYWYNQYRKLSGDPQNNRCIKLNIQIALRNYLRVHQRSHVHNHIHQMHQNPRVLSDTKQASRPYFAISLQMHLITTTIITSKITRAILIPFIILILIMIRDRITNQHASQQSSSQP